MVKAVVLDSGPVGLLTNRNPTREAVACQRWAAALTAAGHTVVLPEIIDYEQRREHIRRNAVVALALLDALPKRLRYLPLDTPTMRRAAELWASARQQGRPTASDKDIDADMILIAQAEALGLPNTIIATGNVGHLAAFYPADLWTIITP